MRRIVLDLTPILAPVHGRRGAALKLGVEHDQCLAGCKLLDMKNVKIEQHSFMGMVWFGAWLFTIGYLHLTFWNGVLAIVLWPYYLGVMFGTTPR
jgi:hypothetical protein